MKRLAIALLLGGLCYAPLPTAKADAFDDAAAQMDQSWDRYAQQIDQAWNRYSNEIKAAWGDQHAKLPSRKDWVSYSSDRSTRSSVDFEKGELEVDVLLKAGEHADDPAVKRRIAQQLEAAIVQPATEDPSLKLTAPFDAVDDVHSKPVQPLKGQLVNASGAPVNKQNAAAFAQQTVSHQRLQSQRIQTPQGEREMVSVRVSLVPDHLRKRAEPFLPQARAMSKRFHVPVSLIFGIMQTESYFNPMARSAVPAFGLMQLVPTSGGLDAYQKVYGEKRVLTPSYLYSPEQNIELGSAYLSLLQSREMRRIKDPKARMLCAIAAYNTGGGNVAKAFIPGSRNIRKASRIINQMSFEEVYQHLRHHLPYEETQNYIKRVWERMQAYKSWDS